MQKVHERKDDAKLRPVLVARQNEKFVFMTRKSLRGQGLTAHAFGIDRTHVLAGGRGHVQITAPPEEVSSFFGMLLLLFRARFFSL